jgi:hypothetical protein
MSSITYILYKFFYYISVEKNSQNGTRISKYFNKDWLYLEIRVPFWLYLEFTLICIVYELFGTLKLEADLPGNS